MKRRNDKKSKREANEKRKSKMEERQVGQFHE